MVFIGSKKELLKISSHFENVWISFIRAFNRLKNDEAQIKALFAQVEILRNEITKKNETISDEQVKKNLSGLWTILNTVYSQLSEMVENMPEMEAMEFSLRKKNVKKEIKRAKGEITLCADALEEYEKTKDLTPAQLSRRQFFQKAGQNTKKGLALALIGSLELTPMIYMGLLALSKDLPKKEDGLAILISYKTEYWWDTALKPFGKLFVPAYVARIEIAFEQKANIVKTAATSNDLLDVLKDKSIQNIVIFGHGTWYSWDATDRDVRSDELKYKEWKNDQKKGLFVRHTCGGERTAEYNTLSYHKKEFAALWEEFYLISQEMESLDSKMIFDLKFIGSKEGVIFLEMWWDNKLILDEKMDAHSSIEKIKKNVMRRTNEFTRQFANKSIEEKMKIFLTHLELYQRNNIVQKEYETRLFGTPHYPRERIKGWDRVSYPWEYMIDVFGDKKLDQMYAQK